jgi:heptosyltransferase-1
MHIAKDQHAVERLRQLFAASLGYSVPEHKGDYGILGEFKSESMTPYVVYLHGTTWSSKHYPEGYWHELIRSATSEGLNVKLLWGNDSEHKRAQRLATDNELVECMPAMDLKQIGNLLISARGAIAVDTGLCHLAAALDCPTLSLYQSTNPGHSGAYGKNQVHLSAKYDCSPCLTRQCSMSPVNDLTNNFQLSITPPCARSIGPEKVWKTFKELLNSA